MRLRSIRFRRQRHRIVNKVDLQLTSLLDILVIILVFLLKSYAASTKVPPAQRVLKIS